MQTLRRMEAHARVRWQVSVSVLEAQASAWPCTAKDIQARSANSNCNSFIAKHLQAKPVKSNCTYIDGAVGCTEARPDRPRASGFLCPDRHEQLAGTAKARTAAAADGWRESTCNRCAAKACGAIGAPLRRASQSSLCNGCGYRGYRSPGQRWHPSAFHSNGTCTRTRGSDRSRSSTNAQ